MITLEANYISNINLKQGTVTITDDIINLFEALINQNVFHRFNLHTLDEKTYETYKSKISPVEDGIYSTFLRLCKYTNLDIDIDIVPEEINFGLAGNMYVKNYSLSEKEIFKLICKAISVPFEVIEDRNGFYFRHDYKRKYYERVNICRELEFRKNLTPSMNERIYCMKKLYNLLCE